MFRITKIKIVFFKYNTGFDRPLFAKNDANKDNSLSVSEFFNFVGDSLDAGLLFEPTDTNRDYHIDATEYCASTGYCSDVSNVFEVYDIP